MGTHATNLAKIKIQTAALHLKVALEALREEEADVFAENLFEAGKQIELAKELFK